MEALDPRRLARGCVVFIWTLLAAVESSQIVNITQTATKSYEEEEEGKLVPYRTFLTTVEIVIICICVVILVFLIVLPIIYVCVFGWRLPACCKRRKQEYSPIQRNRDQKIGEIWKQQYRT